MSIVLADFHGQRKRVGRAKVRAVSVQISNEPATHLQPDVAETQKPRARLTREGIQLGALVVPLLAGSVHYFRLERESWRDCLEALRDMGSNVVDVYVPWSVHERADGSFDFGEHDATRDVVAFLRLVEELGLYALLRPGPHINAELSGFGLPERVLWDAECQARSPAGEPVILPMPPQAFPVPSYASRKLQREACAWLERIAELLGPLAWPDGPIVLLQIDNEGALYFRDGVYEQDYHPDSLALYRRGLEQRYGTPERLAQTYAIFAENFEILPPERFDARDTPGLCRHLDWAEHQETLIAEAFATFRRALSKHGLERLPTCHNLPMGESATPLDPTRLGKVVECLGMDYYHVADAHSADAILRRTSEVVTRADAFEYPAFAVELAAGFPPFFPPLTERDNIFAALSCLAAGIRGFNLYMAVERDRWIGSPIDRFGTPRPSFETWRRLNEAVLRNKLYELSRAADVCVVVPRSVHRLERLLHAFGPLSAAALDLMGRGAYDSCFEQGPFATALFEAESFLRALLQQLTTRGVAYRMAGNDGAVAAVDQSRFAFVVSSGGLEPELWEALSPALRSGKAICFGPTLPLTSPDGQQMLNQLPTLPIVNELELPTRLGELVAQKAPLILDAGAGIRSSLFQDRGGVPRVLFVTNTSPLPLVARLEAGFLNEAVDALDGHVFRATVRALEVPLSPQSVRMLELK
jgi:beta-galactosidase